MSKNIVYLSGGLGNQMFQYAFYMALQEKQKNVCCDGTKFHMGKKLHNGLELEFLFHVSPIVHKTNSLLFRCFNRFLIYREIEGRDVLLNLLSFFGLRVVVDTVPPVYSLDIMTYRRSFKTFYLGHWQTDKYFKHMRPSVLKIFQFDQEKLSEASSSCYERLKRDDCSVSIHIRRGDYLLEKHKVLYGGICDEDYYKRAISLMREKVANVRFYVFSDDIEWVKKNLPIPDAVFIDWNTGKDSWQDMFLMSQCKHNIIANSTFSWWGAWLNTHPNKRVISPSRFLNINKKSDIIPDEWLAI